MYDGEIKVREREGAFRSAPGACAPWRDAETKQPRQASSKRMFDSGDVLLSRGLSPVLASGLQRFTAVFGMGTGGTTLR